MLYRHCVLWTAEVARFLWQVCIRLNFLNINLRRVNIQYGSFQPMSKFRWWLSTNFWIQKFFLGIEIPVRVIHCSMEKSTTFLKRCLRRHLMMKRWMKIQKLVMKSLHPSLKMKSRLENYYCRGQTINGRWCLSGSITLHGRPTGSFTHTG